MPGRLESLRPFASQSGCKCSGSASHQGLPYHWLGGQKALEGSANMRRALEGVEPEKETWVGREEELSCWEARLHVWN